jgi:hypothetical protein
MVTGSTIDWHLVSHVLPVLPEAVSSMVTVVTMRVNQRILYFRSVSLKSRNGSFERGMSRRSVFQSADGVLWQLCDVGLGWTAFESSQPNWTTNAEIQKHLPTTVISRPSSSAHWNYNFELRNNILLSVRFSSKGCSILLEPGTKALRLRPRAILARRFSTAGAICRLLGRDWIKNAASLGRAFTPAMTIP